MNENETAGKITAYLDSGAASLKAGTAYRLQLARQKAIAQLGEQREHAAELALAPGGNGSSAGGRRSSLTSGAPVWIGILTLTVGILFYQQWQTVKQTREVEETDAALLTSDLPIEAYLDRGFQRWLTTSEP